MLVFENVREMQKWSLDQKKAGKTIGLVPTMGYLHAGHLALVKEAAKASDIVVVSIFVNPMQFGQGEDFEEYPRDISRDISLLKAENVAAVFAPSARDMYPVGYSTFLEVTGEMTNKLCGKKRPGHFKGVTTVVSKLFNICIPDVAYFGQKDIQQVIVIEKMVKELNFSVKIERVPIVREASGLAMSSRNVYLDEVQKEAALVLYKALQYAEKLINGGEKDTAVLSKGIESIVKAEKLAIIDYIEIVDDVDLANVANLSNIKGSVVIALAVKIGSTRLIDNLVVEV
ncbi:MAG: pantoate--beta-alanine ligase [Syntrophomonadaceae bacterium]|nr:pantoate--beta-alanine ligase [Syntrophomonadaceae bacterium]